jgi:hypothetical protein
MKKNMLLVSLSNFSVNFTLHRDFIAKCVAFLELFKDQYDFYLLDYEIYRNHEVISDYNTSSTVYAITSYRDEISKIIPINKVYTISIYDEYERIKKNKNFDAIHPANIPFDVPFDIVYTFNNHVDPGFNRAAHKKQLTYREIKILSMSKPPEFFDYMLYRYSAYLILNETFRRLHVHKLQLISDPLDLRFDGFRYLLPDIPEARHINGILYEYFPFYQYFYFIHSRPIVREKEYLLIVGSTLYDKWRREMFDKYLLELFKKEIDNPQYRWYLTGELFGKPYNSFIEASEFNREAERTRYGMVLNTYAKDIISTNKVSNFISRNCVPVICEGADVASGFFPKKLLGQLQVSNGSELERLLKHADYDRLNEMIQGEYSYYYEIQYYTKVFSAHFSTDIVELQKEKKVENLKK